MTRARCFFYLSCLFCGLLLPLAPIKATTLTAYFETPENRAANSAGSIRDEVYTCGDSSIDSAMSAGVTLMSHMPLNADTLREAHSKGIKLLPYISLYKVLDFSEAEKSESTFSTFSFNMPWKDHPFWKELDCSKNPGWTKTNSNGEREKPFRNKQYDKGCYASRISAPGLKDAYVRGVDNIMKAGYDGVFIDNVESCYIFKDSDEDKKAHLETLAEIYRKVKSYGESKYVVLNASDSILLGNCDAGMLESYICSFRKDDPNRRYPPGKIHSMAVRASSVGKPMMALSYMTGRHTPEDAVYAFACAEASGFTPVVTPLSGNRMLYRARLGAPVSELTKAPDNGDLWLRFFKKGFVIINHSPQKYSGQIPAPEDYSDFADAVTGRGVSSGGGVVNIEMEPQTAAVYIRRGQFIVNCLLECQCQLARLGLKRSLEAADARAKISETLKLLSAEKFAGDTQRKILEKLREIIRVSADLSKAQGVNYPQNKLLTYASAAYLSAAGIGRQYSVKWENDLNAAVLNFTVGAPYELADASLKISGGKFFQAEQTNQTNEKNLRRWSFRLKPAEKPDRAVSLIYTLDLKDKNTPVSISDSIDIPAAKNGDIFAEDQLFGPAFDEFSYIIRTNPGGSIVVQEKHPIELFARQVGVGPGDNDFLENLTLLIRKKDDGRVLECNLSGDKIIGNKASAEDLVRAGRAAEQKNLILCSEPEKLKFSVDWTPESPGIYELGIRYSYTDYSKSNKTPVTHWLGKYITID